MYLPVVCVVPRKTVWHKLAQEAGSQGEGGQQGGGAGQGRKETLQIGFYLDPAQKEKHLPPRPNQVHFPAQLQELRHRRVQVAVC